MLSKRYQFPLIISILLTFSLACALTGETGDITVDPEAAVATSVAATLAAQEAMIQTREAEPTLEPDILFQGVSFDYDDSLAAFVNAEIIPAYIDDINSLLKSPEHIQFTFTGFSLTGSFLPARINIYPVEEYLAVNPFIEDRLNNLENVLNTQPPDEEEVEVVDIFNGEQFFCSQVDYLEFQNGRGVRFLTQYGQAYSPIGWPHLFYAFQGFTDDGAYFVSAFFPVHHPSLPHPDDVVLGEAFEANYENYAAELEVELDLFPPDSFIPDLMVLDEVVETMLVGE